MTHAMLNASLTFNVTTTGRRSRPNEGVVVSCDEEGSWRHSPAHSLLSYQGFFDTHGVTYQLIVTKGDEFRDEDRVTSFIREETARRGYDTPPVEVAPCMEGIISEGYLERMDFKYLVVLTEPIEDPHGHSPFLVGFRHSKDRRLYAFDARPNRRWRSDVGFVSLVPQPQL